MSRRTEVEDSTLEFSTGVVGQEGHDGGTYPSHPQPKAGDLPDPLLGPLTSSFCKVPNCTKCTEDVFEVTKTPFSQKIFSGNLI